MTIPVDDLVRVRQLVEAYGDAVNRRAWTDLDALFHPAAEITLDLRLGKVLSFTGPGQIGDFIAEAIDRFDFFAFVPLTVHTTPGSGPDDLTGRVWIAEQRHEAAADAWSTAYGLYQDQYERDGERWRFRRRSYSSLARRGAGGGVFPPPLLE